MKKTIYLLFLMLVVCLVACGESYSVTANDIELEEGTSVNVTYTIEPGGVLDAATLTIVDQTVDGCITISNTQITANLPGEAIVKLTVSNIPGDKVEFSAETTFKVTVTAKEVIPTDDVITNGSFENGLEGWELTLGETSDTTATYKTDVAGDQAYAGEAAFNLWYNPAGEGAGVAIDLIATQTVTMKSDTYLLSFWYKGSVTSITATISQGETVLKTQSFAGYDYVAVSDSGYVNYGFEVEVTAGEYVVELAVVGPDGSWGYIDAVTLEPGTEDDLVVPDGNPEEGQYNFLEDATITETKGTDATDATVTASEVKIWGNSNGTVEYTGEYTLTDLPERTYNLCVYVNGAETEFDECYVYVTIGETTHKVETTPIGWNNGIYARFASEDLTLSGDVTVGIYVKASTEQNNWVNFKDLCLYSTGYVPVPSSDTSCTNITVCGVEVVEEAVALPTASLEQLTTATDLTTLVTATLHKKASITSVTYSENVLTITVTAEDKSTASYTVNVSEATSRVWQDATIDNPSFDSYIDVTDSDWKATDWTVTGATDEWLVTGDAQDEDGRGMNLWGKLTVETDFVLTQDISDLQVGDQIELKFYLNSAASNATIKIMFGEHTEDVTITTEWSYYQVVSTQYEITEADLAEGVLTFGLIVTPLIENATVKLDNFTVRLYK